MRQIALPDLDAEGFLLSYGPWAVIAGASEGSGACYAAQLAAMGFNLVLVSRRLAALEELGREIAARHKVGYRAVVQDLMAEGAGAALDQATAGLDVGLFIYNTGTAGAGGSFLDTPLAQARRVLTMNAGTVSEAVHGFGNRFRARGRGGIILMASVAGLGGQPWLAMYSATKAFEINLAESLWAELRNVNVDILAMAAPAMNTPTLQRNVQGTGFDMSTACDPADVVHLALARLGQTPIAIIPDGPEAEKLEGMEAARFRRVVLFAEWAAAYTSSRDAGEARPAGEP